MRRFRGVGSVIVGLSLLGLVRGAAADTVEATRYEMIERAHSVDVRVDRGVATLVVTRTVLNRGPKSDQAMFHLDIPDKAVATRLRTAGTNAKGEEIWFEGELMEAEAAAAKYKELSIATDTPNRPRRQTALPISTPSRFLFSSLRRSGKVDGVLFPDRRAERTCPHRRRVDG